MAYVQEIGKKLELQSGERTLFSYTVLDTPIVQGLADWSGNITLTRGMLNVISSEAELACLLGHEIGHVQLKHGKRSKTRVPPTVYDGLSNLIKKYSGVRIETEKFQALERAFWSRDGEREADEFGAILAHKAGYNPYALATLFRRLSSLASFDLLEWLDTPERSHAYLLSRASHLELFLKQKGIGPVGETSAPKYKQKLGFLDQEVSNSSQKLLLESLEALRRDVAQHIQSNTPIELGRFLQIMEELSRMAQTHHLAKYFSPGTAAPFMAESIEQGSPLWGDFGSVLAANLAETLATLGQVGVGFIPVIGDAVDFYEAVTGDNFFTGEPLTPAEQALSAVAMIIGSGKAYREAAEQFRAIAHTMDDGGDLSKAIERAEKFLEKEPLSARKFESDLQLPKSAGARAADIDLGGGAKIPAGSKITNVENIAKGSGIREVDRLVSEYGGNRRNWAKRKGYTRIVQPDGSSVLAEVHWYEGHGVGAVEFKVKRTE